MIDLPALDAAWLVAPLGASAVLVFAVPSSPLAQPWSVIGGNTLSALVGAACAHFIHDPAWAAAARALSRPPSPETCITRPTGTRCMCLRYRNGSRSTGSASNQAGHRRGKRR
jgi:hypothetical protein